MLPISLARLASLAGFAGTTAGVLAQGSLTPLGGPAPTMKTLDQIEARTLIPGGTAPFVINSAGSYYLTGNLAVSGATAITVNASNVTVDLNGFTISSTASPAAGTTVLIGSGRASVTVQNGNISGPGTVSATGTFAGGGFANGVIYDSSAASAPPNGIRAHGLAIAGCSGDGINFLSTIGTPSISSVERCVVRNVGNYGIFASTLRSCSALNCGVIGILSEVASDCTASVLGGPGFALRASRATNCQGITTGAGDGLNATNATNCYGYSNTGRGLYADVALNCEGETATGPRGLSSANATNCFGRASGGGGFALSASTAVGCGGSYEGSETEGVGLYSPIASHCAGNCVNGYGIQASKSVESCSGSSDRAAGIYTASAQNSRGTSGGNGAGLLATDNASNCVGTSVSGYGIQTDVAENCKGTSTSGVGLYALTAMNCRGTSSGAAFGLQAVNAATNCFGTSNSGTGLRTPTAMNCFGQTSAGTAAPALFAITANLCRGWQTTGVGVALQADLAVTCTSQAGTFLIGIRYNMP